MQSLPNLYLLTFFWGGSHFCCIYFTLYLIYKFILLLMDYFEKFKGQNTEVDQELNV